MENQLTPLQKAAASRKMLEAGIIAQAWADEAFRAKLEADPAAALAEAGIPAPAGRTIRIVTEEPGTLTIVLPPAPTEASDAELASVAGGGLISDGKCHLFERAKENDGVAIGVLAAAAGAFFGASWAWA